MSARRYALFGALSVTLAFVGSPVLVEPVAAAAAVLAPAEDESVRPDSVSAMVTARSTGQRVEDSSQRDEVTRVFANPDGSWTSETSAEPESVQDPATGEWKEIDTTLVAEDGGLRAKAAFADVLLSDGGDKVFVQLTEQNRDLDWKWTGTLPKPVVEGSTATYQNVVSNGDLVVTATATGFTYNIVLRSAPATALVLKMPIATHGAVMQENPQGGLVVSTQSGDMLAEAPAPMMWDSSENVAGDPDVNAVDASVATANGTPTLTLAPAQSFLTDPDTVYPVTIDPSFTSYASGDAWVQNAEFTSGMTASDEMRAGTYDSGSHKARSFLKFNDNRWNGKKILSADLVLRNWLSLSCAGSAIRASVITQAWTGASLTWSNQPSVSASNDFDYSPAWGGPSGSCTASGDATWTMTNAVQGWANTPSTNYGFRLTAVNESTNNSWRRYRSSQQTTGGVSLNPKIVVTWSNFPEKAETPALSTTQPSATGYSTSTTPTFKSVIRDVDGGPLRGDFEVLEGATSKWIGYSCSITTSGSCASSPTTASKAITSGILVDGHTYTVRARAYDGSSSSQSYSTSTTFTVDNTKPAVAVAASGFTNNTWTTTPPGSNTFTFDGPTDTKSYSVIQDGVGQPVVPAMTSGSIGDATYPWAPARGAHTLVVTPTDKAGNAGAAVTFAFGTGEAGFALPNPDQRSTGVFPVQASAEAGATSATLSWRRAGQTVWEPATGVKNSAGAAWSGAVTTTGGAATTEGLTWDASTAIDPDTTETIAAPALLELQTCFAYVSPAPQVCSTARQIQLVPQAFGGRFPVASAGPAQVALFTGEYTLSQTDAVDSAAGVGRSFSSYDASTTSTTGPFGLGWSDTLLSATSEDTSARIVDNRASDNAFVLVAEGWGSQTYEQDGATDVYKPTGPDDGSRLTLVAADTLTLTEIQGATTTWKFDTGTSTWDLDTSVPQETGAVQTTYKRTGSTAFISEVPPGTTAPNCSLTIQSDGCRGLKVTYTGSQVTKVERIAYDPVPGADGKPTVTDTATMTTTVLAAYTYTGDQLTKVCNPTISATFCVQYAYQTVAGRTVLDTVTPPGQAPWRFSYDSTGRLTTVKRALDPATGTGDATWTVKYDLSTTTAGLPTISTATAAEWGQTDIPTNVYAVFGPNREPAGTPSATDLQYAQVFWVGNDGEVTNTGTYGAGTWLVDTTWYDDNDNVVRHLGGPGYAQVQAAGSADRLGIATAASEYTVYNPTGSRVEDEFGPVHTATLKDGTIGAYRSHTSYDYDDEAAGALVPGKPTLPADLSSWDMVVDTKHSVANADRTGTFDEVITRNSYEPIATGDASGWTLGTPTSVKTQIMIGGAWAESITRSNNQGQVIETRQPGGAETGGVGTDAHATQYVYWTAGSNVIDAECGGSKAWAGTLCRVGPAGHPAGTTMPTTYTLGFNAALSPTRVEGRSSGTKRISVTTNDVGGRPTKSSVSVTGGDAADPSAALVTDYTYDANGQPDTQTMGAKQVQSAYDTWGRTKSYIDASGLTSTTTYTPDGSVASMSDGIGTYTYSYDPAGMPTLIDVGLATGPDVFTYTYDTFGNPTTIGYPNGTVATRTYDEIGIPTGLSYANGTTPLLSFAVAVDVDGRTVSNRSTGSGQKYTFDNIGRLTKVQDTRDTGCTTRTYGFSITSERTSKTTYAPDVAGDCQTTTTSGSWSGTYDTASRIKNTGYTYDNLGRTRTTPAADTPAGGQSALTNTYYPNDMIASMAQTVDTGAGGSSAKTMSYALDTGGRIDTIIAKTNATETSRSLQRYSDTSDSPSSIRGSTNGGTTWTDTRYIGLPGLGMTASNIGTTTTIQLENLHGDIVATQPNATGTTTISSYDESDEYGNATAASTPSRYGWLGSLQRSGGNIGGVVLMGARIYNPATGNFGSLDPVSGGNYTAYGYPLDPINQADPDGQCFLGHGSNCGRWAKNIKNHDVRITNRAMEHIYEQHGIRSIQFVEEMIERGIYDEAYTLANRKDKYPLSKNYSYLLHEDSCIGSVCVPNGRQVLIRFWVDWAYPGQNKGRLGTMYCYPYSGKCPPWLLKYVG